MAKMRNGVAGLAAILAVLALGEARAENGDRSNDAPSALNCAAKYATHVDASFHFMDRQMALMERFDLNAGEITIELGRNDDLFFTRPVESIVQGLAECDRAFGFSPITQVINARPGIPQTPSIPQIADFDCAVAYRLLAAIRHDIDQDQERAQQAMERAQYALRLHQTANPELDLGSLRAQVSGLARTRGERIQQGQETVETLFNDINACEAKYGFAQDGGQ